MKILKNFAGGLAGAIALNILHETAKRYLHAAPRVDLVVEEAVKKIAETADIDPPKGDNLYLTTLVGDVLSNAVYYSFIGAGKKKNLLLRGAGSGLVAGLGALTLTKPIGLSDAPVNRSNTTKALTVTWYVFGGLVTALTINALRKK